MVFAHQGNESIIITARHCVTTDGNVDSELVPNSWVKVALGPAPGPANPNPPTSGRNPIFIDAMPITSAADYTRDAAIIYLYAPTWAWLADRSIGVHVSPPAPDLTFYAYGYGLNSRDNNCYGNAAYFQSSGILRRGELVTLDGGTVVGQSGYFDYNYTSSGPSVICGDSGGPDVGLIAPNMLWDVFLGEHTLDFPPAMINTSATPGPWMSQAIGGFYVSPVSSPSLNVRRMSDDYVGLDSISVGTPLIYDAVARTITHNNACLDWTSTFNRFVFTGCNTSRPRQQWMATPIGQLVNPASGLCMYHSASGLMEMRSCPPSTATQAERARFTWVWHAQK